MADRQVTEATEADILAKYTSEAPSLLPEEDDEKSLLERYNTGAQEDDEEAAVLGRYQPPVTKESDILGALKRGAEMSLLPFGVDAAEVNKERTKGEKIAETVAQIATDIGSSVAVSAGAGAAVGSVVPGAGTAAGVVAGSVAGLGLGIYRALGYEDLMSRSKGEEFNPARAGLNVLAESNPALRLGSKFVKFVSQGALQAAQTLAYDGDAEDAAVGALLGGSLSALGHRGLKPGELKSAGLTALIVDPKLGPKAMQDVMDVLSEDGARKTLMQHVVDDLQATKRTPIQDLLAKPETLERLAADGGTEADSGALITEATDLARFLTRDYKLKGQELFDLARKELKATGMSLDEAVESMRFQNAVNVATEKAAEGALKEGTRFRDPLDNTLLRSLSDQKYAARLSDNTTGLDLEPKFAQVSVAKNRKNQFVFWATSSTNKLLREAKKAKLDRTKIGTMLEAGADKGATGVNPAQQEVLVKFRALYDSIQESANNAGLEIGDVDNYVTRVTKSPADLITSIRQRARKYIKPDGNVSGNIWRDNELLSVLQTIDGSKITETSQNWRLEVKRIINSLDDPETLQKRKGGFNASAAFERSEDAMPEFIREQDIGKVLMTYATNLGNAIYMDPAIRQLEIRVPALKTLGQKNTAQWLERQIGSLSGQKSGFLQWVSNQEVRWKTHIDQVLDTQELSKLQTGSLKAARFAPDLISWGMSQIYPNYLGFSLKAVTRNLSQTQLLTAGEVGGDYGHRIAMRAAVETALDRRRGINLQKALEAQGLHPGEHITEGMNVLHNELDKTLIGGLVRAADGVGKVGMWMYGKTDAINRYMTMKMSKRVAKDIEAAMANTGKHTRDQRAALAFMKKMPAGYRNELYKAARDGKGVERGITEYLLSTTQFDYGPQAMSEFGQTFGRFASMFTKWPAMVAGDVHYLATTKQYAKAAEKYLAPFAALAAVDLWLDESKKDERLRAVLGRNMKEWSPVASLKVSMPPALEIAGNVGKGLLAAVSLDLKGAVGAAGKAIEPVLPFNSLRLGLKDKVIYNLIKNKKAPEFLEGLK